MGQPGNGRGRPKITRTRAQVNPAAPERSNNVLPWEIFACLWTIRSRVTATSPDAGGEVSLFDVALKASLRHGDTGDGGTGAGACAEPQASTAWERQRALTRHLMEEVASSANLNLAYKRVKGKRSTAHTLPVGAALV